MAMLSDYRQPFYNLEKIVIQGIGFAILVALSTKRKYEKGDELLIMNNKLASQLLRL
ncbi:MAG: hypothetical protein ACSLEL_01590 [Candidatus Malihini olakiniferum]